VSARFTVADVLAWTGGRLVAGEAQRRCHGAGIDSRRVTPDSVFVAIRGPRHDAHDFLAQAAAAGAACLVVARDAVLPAAARERCAVIEVADTTAALSALGAGYRATWTGPVVAITGSNGKTTTKEMCAAVLGMRGACARTEGNLNNQFGLPLTLLARDGADWAAVVEIGMNHAGEILPLAAIARPSVGVITNVGTAHIEHLGSQDAIAREKGALFEALGEDGVAVANADDARVVAQLARTKARPLLFGLGAGADVRADRIEAAGAAGCRFALATPAGSAGARVAGIGRIPVVNALGAAAGALGAGATLDEIVAGLDAYRPPRGRLHPIALPHGGVLLDDTYNANPQSMEVALQSLAEHKGARGGIAVIGDMGELGATAAAAHRAAGRLAATLGLDFVIALGAHAERVVAGALEGGLAKERAVAARDHDDAAERVREALRDGDWVLVKGSRSMQMERVVASLTGAESGH
jgi:UDP-N-acetylmuramoyl-tripeptide--D-alanyl-D-alanine ligase